MMRRRTFAVLRSHILRAIATGQKTVNQLATETEVNWKTVDNHLTYLVGKGYVKVVFSSPYVKIFEISETGKERLSHEVKKS